MPDCRRGGAAGSSGDCSKEANSVPHPTYDRSDARALECVASHTSQGFDQAARVLSDPSSSELYFDMNTTSLSVNDWRLCLDEDVCEIPDDVILKAMGPDALSFKESASREEALVLPQSARSRFHLHFGAGRLGMGLVVPVRTRSAPQLSPRPSHNSASHPAFPSHHDHLPPHRILSRPVPAHLAGHLSLRHPICGGAAAQAQMEAALRARGWAATCSHCARAPL